MGDEAHTDAASALQEYGRPLEVVQLFKYLGKFLIASDNDWQAVVYNWRKAHQKWDRISRNLGWGGGGGVSDTWTFEKFYKAAMQVVLLFKLETWVTTPTIGRNLGGFHHRADQ